MFHLMCVHIFSSVWVPEWPLLGAKCSLGNHMFSLYFNFLYPRNTKYIGGI